MSSFASKNELSKIQGRRPPQNKYLEILLAKLTNAHLRPDKGTVVYLCFIFESMHEVFFWGEGGCVTQARREEMLSTIPTVFYK